MQNEHVGDKITLVHYATTCVESHESINKWRGMDMLLKCGNPWRSVEFVLKIDETLHILAKWFYMTKLQQYFCLIFIFEMWTS